MSSSHIRKHPLPLQRHGWYDTSRPSRSRSAGRLLLAALLSGALVFAFLFRPDVFPPIQRSTHLECNCTDLKMQQQGTLGDRELLGNGSVVRTKFLGFVGLLTSFSSKEHRKALRATWLPSEPEGMARLEQATGLTFRFIIGKSADSKEMVEVDKEIEKYKDFLRVDFDEDDPKLARKTLAFFKTAYALFDAEFYVKAEDSIYLRPDRLATLLAKERKSLRTYIGCMTKGSVVTNPKARWYEPLGFLLGSEYFYHANGPIYVLSSEVVATLASSRNDSFRLFAHEDITVGAWMLGMNVDHEDNQHLCDPKCTDRSIAVWDFPKCAGLCDIAQRMRELHKIRKCANSPTLPAEEE